MIRKWKLLLCTLVFAFCSAIAHAQMAAFNDTTNVLTLNLLKFENAYYTGTKVYLSPSGSWTLQTLGAPTSAARNSEPAVYNSADSTVRFPHVLVAGSLFDNLVLSLPLDGRPWSLMDAGMVAMTMSYGITYPLTSTVSNDQWNQSLLRLDNGQTWHVETGPCFPASAQAALDESSSVQIYPFKDAGKFNMDVSFDADFATCTVSPVSGIFPVNPAGPDLKVSPTAITGMAAETRDLYISGGTPPYFAVIDNPSIAAYSFQPYSLGEPGQTLRVYLKASGTANLSVYDAIASGSSPILVPISVDDNPAFSAPAFSVIPNTVTFQNIPASYQFSIMLSGGVPPYKMLFNPMPLNFAIEDFDGSRSPTKVNVYLFQSVGGGSAGQVQGYLVFMDSIGQTAAVNITAQFGGQGIFN